LALAGGSFSKIFIASMVCESQHGRNRASSVSTVRFAKLWQANSPRNERQKQ